MLKNLKVLAIVLCLITIGFSQAQAESISAADGDLALPAEARVLHAVTAMYVPVDNLSWWMGTICLDMTAGGCEYFKNNQADMLWHGGQGVLGDGVHGLQVVRELQDGLQVWKMTIVIHTSQNEKLTHDIYVLVRLDEVQKNWLLDCILYGPYIDFAE